MRTNAIVNQLILSTILLELSGNSVSSFSTPFHTSLFLPRASLGDKRSIFGSSYSRLNVSSNVEETNSSGRNNESGKISHEKQTAGTRRSLLTQTAKSILAGSSTLLLSNNGSKPASAAVGTLPEFSETNAVLQGLTINISEYSQLLQMVNFLKDSFDFKVLRQNQFGTVTEVWLGFGPEELSIPKEFEIPVSSFGEYGGHSSIHLRFDSRDTNVYFNPKSGNSDAPGNNIAYLQVGVPTYRVSQMVKNGGNILDAYGFVNVISPCGLPMRSIVGISPDPIMFVALNCDNVSKSKEFYEQSLGMSVQPYPFARPSNGMGQFEPPQPKGSVYLAHTPYNMGVLLLPKQTKGRSGITPNPVVRSLNIVYSPPESSSSEDSIAVEALEDISGADPSKVNIAFTPAGSFSQHVKTTLMNPNKLDI